MKNPEISVGIVSALKISFTLNGIFKAKGESISGNQEVSLSEGGILWKDNLYKELTFIPQEEQAFFSLHEPEGLQPFA